MSDQSETKKVDESQFKTLRELSRDSTLSQRDLSKRVGLSVGSVNHIISVLLGKGYIKAQRFKNTKNKMAYRYILTPKGVRERICQTTAFLRSKTAEHERLQQEIAMLECEQFENSKRR